MAAENEPANDKGKTEVKAYLKYSGMAFQMIVVLLIAAYAGQWLDKHFNSTQPWFTLVLLLIGVTASMYIIIKTVTRP